MRLALISWAFFLVYACSSDLCAQSIEFVGATAFSGPYRQIEIRGNYAFCLGSQSLKVFSIADDAAPVLIGECFVAGANDLEIQDNLAYCSGIHVIDISNPQSPSIIGGQLDTSGSVYRVEVLGNYAYQVKDPYHDWESINFLEIIDISNPQAPFTIGMEPYYVNDIALRGHKAYLASSVYGLLTLDVSNPSHPVILDSLTLPRQAGRVILHGDYAYLSWGSRHDAELYVVNISDSIAVLSATFAPRMPVNEMVADGTYLFLSEYGIWPDTSNVFEIVDISNPAVPQLTGSYYAARDSAENYIYQDNLDLAVSGERLYLASGDLEVLDVSDASNPLFLAEHDKDGFILEVEVVGNYAYLANGRSLLSIVDMTDINSPVRLSFADSGTVGYSLAYSGIYAYVQGYSSLQVVDISDPTFPNVVGGLLPPDWHSGDLTAANSFLYSAGNQFSIYDISDPITPVLVGAVAGVAGAYRESVIRGDYVYTVTDWWDRGMSFGNFCMVDVSHPSEPFIFRLFMDPTGGTGRAIAISGDYAYAGLGVAMYIFDISNPDSTNFISHFYPTAGYSEIFDILIRNNLAYLAVYGWPDFTGILIADVSDPFQPTEVARFSLPAAALDIALLGDYILVADFSALQVLRFVPTAVEYGDEPRSEFSMMHTYPNPFNSSSTISFELAEPSRVTLDVYNLLGQKMVTLFDGAQDAGPHKVVWNAEGVPSGTYIARLTTAAGETRETRMVLVK